MKVTLNFQDTADDALHTSLKITLPKKWPAGPTEKLLAFFVASYSTLKMSRRSPTSQGRPTIE